MFSHATGKTYQLDIAPDRLLIESVNPDVDSEGTCYLGVFPQTEGRQDAWYLGNMILAEYYVVFDMEDWSVDMDANKHLKVGFAPKNPAGLTYEQHPSGYFSSNGVHEGIAATAETRVNFERQPGVPSSGGGAGGIIVVLLLICAGGGAGYWFWKKRQSGNDTSVVRE